jgi:hypothetical protein
MIINLKKEEWDFSSLQSEELLPALRWETRRECADVEQRIVAGRAWLAGKLSTKKPPMPKDKRTGRRPRYNTNFSEAETACLKAGSIFPEFIPYGESLWLHNQSAKQKRAEHDRWLAGYLRPLVDNYDVPWLHLPESERHRLCKIVDRIKDMNVVRIGTWWDAVGTFKKQKPDAYQPLKFDYSDYTTVLLTINWCSSKKRILAAIGKIVRQIEPPGIKHWDRRGKKDRDQLVMLERLAVMRLLHHYTLSELKLRLPDAWSLYSHRKWYDERRQALKDFRSVIGYSEPEKFFPKSWETKAQHSRNASKLPAK